MHADPKLADRACRSASLVTAERDNEYRGQGGRTIMNKENIKTQSYSISSQEYRTSGENFKGQLHRGRQKREKKR